MYRKIVSTMSLYTDSESAQIGITAMFSILVSTDLIGNTVVVLVVILNRDMRYFTCFNVNVININIRWMAFGFSGEIFKTTGALNWNKNSGLNFWKFQLRMNQHLPEFPGKRTTSRGTSIFYLEFYFRNSTSFGFPGKHPKKIFVSFAYILNVFHSIFEFF